MSSPSKSLDSTISDTVLPQKKPSKRVTLPAPAAKLQQNNQTSTLLGNPAQQSQALPVIPRKMSSNRADDDFSEHAVTSEAPSRATTTAPGGYFSGFRSGQLITTHAPSGSATAPLPETSHTVGTPSNAGHINQSIGMLPLLRLRLMFMHLRLPTRVGSLSTI